MKLTDLKAIFHSKRKIKAFYFVNARRYYYFSSGCYLPERYASTYIKGLEAEGFDVTELKDRETVLEIIPNAKFN